MCRLLAVKDRNPFAIAPPLAAFAAMARASREYQGDGWGLAWIPASAAAVGAALAAARVAPPRSAGVGARATHGSGGDKPRPYAANPASLARTTAPIDPGWQVYRSVTPIWDDDLERFGETSLLVAHTRSAFRNEGIRIENNMPFVADGVAFAFNGELHGVRIREQGRIGAEKVFNTIRRLTNGDLAAGLGRAVAFIRARSRYVRALNLVLVDRERIVAHCEYGEQPDYFTLHAARENGRVAVCSEPLPGCDGWRPIANSSTEVFK